MKFINLNNVSLAKKKNIVSYKNLLSNINSKKKTNGKLLLKNINLKLNNGDKLGIVGLNGAGKTTLLRLISGIYSPTFGKLETNCRINSLIDLMLGMQPNLSGINNIINRCLIMGLPLSEIKKNIPEIVKFSELKHCIHDPVSTYSSGMLLKLFFSISIFYDFDALILDEWLAVGDKEFTKKTHAALTDVISKNKIFVLASHSPDILEANCNKFILMDKGQIIRTGNELSKLKFF
jgi:lipopolysaccharide transport system ATP-binding protein